MKQILLITTLTATIAAPAHASTHTVVVERGERSYIRCDKTMRIIRVITPAGTQLRRQHDRYGFALRYRRGVAAVAIERHDGHAINLGRRTVRIRVLCR